MKKASLITLGLGAVTTFTGFSGLNGSTPVWSAVTAVAGMLVFLAGMTLYESYKIKKQEQAKAFSEKEQRKDEFIKVWESCQM